MSNELLSPEVQLDSQDMEEDKATKDIEQEVECQTLKDRYILSRMGLSLVMK